MQHEHGCQERWKPEIESGMTAAQQQSLQNKFDAQILQRGKDRKCIQFYKDEESIEHTMTACTIMARD